jgi:hypothetical protein
MAPRSKFLDILNENAKFIKEGKFVKGDEDSELPPMGDEEDVPEEPQGGEEEQPQPQPQPEEEPEVQAPETTFTDREQDILNVAVQIYRQNDQNPIEYKNDFSNMLEKGQYEQLLGRLIAIADELLD